MKAVNLLPPEQRDVPKAASAPAASGPPVGAFGVLGVLALAVVALAVYVLAGNTVNERQTELAQTTQQADVAEQHANSLQRYADFKRLADQRVATVRGLAASRFDWDEALRDLSRALPSDVHLNTITGTTSTAGASGGNELRSAIAAPAIELSGCTTSQAAVARLMSRLHDVRGVTRVALSKSSAEDTASSGAPAAPDATGESLCPKGAAPSFEMVAFFERSAVPAAAAPNAASGATTPATAPVPGAAPAPGAAATPAPTPAAGPAPGAAAMPVLTEGIAR